MKKIGLGLLLVVLAILSLAIWNNAESSNEFLEEQLVKIEGYFEKKDIRNLEISKSGVGWHLDHMLKVINNISDSLAISNPSDYTATFNTQRVFVHTTGYIPRGAAQAPTSVTPPEIILLDSLRLQLKNAKQNLKTFENLNADAHFKHPVFDYLNRNQTRRFLEVHTKHHLKIIADILEE
ncbi:DUF1569 domain-containing protein [Croceivirga thetidis]|uniref:DUF1569 domain-containing protein n=1 Tax=Croceivirga thetidis TaxID=2721623 RepID=A0ABX1GRH9_9FLAO|nr:DUF1569 domain-containing protein [Croceivirga thetidis]NKI31530.1 DUF1569 domain-containing protein [Croceivirga thetidis]